MTSPSETSAPPKSTFVTVVGWIFLAFSAFATLITLMQNVMIFMVFPLGEMNAAVSEDPEMAELPRAFRFFLAHPWVWFAFCFLVSATTLVASIGLLRRRNWARLLFIGVLAFGIAWNLGSVPLTWILMPSDSFSGGNSPPEIDRFMVVMQVFMAGFALAFATLFAWIIRRLISDPIRAEFRTLR